MTAHTKLRMTADEFIPWAMNQPKRYELVEGEVVPMSPERAAHTRTKHLVWRALMEAVQTSPGDYEVLGDGMSVRISETTVYEPDTLVRRGPPVDDEVVEVDDPVIVVEVVSPSSYALDTGAKLSDYFRLPSVRHYLVIETKNRTVIHHERAADGRIETRIVRAGALVIDPPGIAVKVESFFTG